MAIFPSGVESPLVLSRGLAMGWPPMAVAGWAVAAGWPGSTRSCQQGEEAAEEEALVGGPSNYKKKPSVLGRLLTCFGC